VGCSRRKTTSGNSHCPASLASAAGRFSAQERRGDRALLLVWSDNSKVARWWLALVGKEAVGAEQSSEERRSNGGRGGSETGGGLLW
jgi:hypothetical protein